MCAVSVVSGKSTVLDGPRIRCPLCAWSPGKEDRWFCICGHEWNTFDTGGVCPAREQLQVYLDEFVFRHNRRKFPMAAFQNLLGLGAGSRATPYQQIRGAADLSIRFPADDPRPLRVAGTTG